MKVKRTYVLASAVALAVAAAGSLRIYWQASRPEVRLRPGPTTRAALPAVPRDRVAEPAVAEGEREAGPQRIVSLAPSITEVVAALGLADRLAGRTPYCHWPPSVASVPAVGALTDPNFEKIKSLSPEVVLITSNSGRLAAGLGRLGLRYEAVPHETLGDVYRAIEVVGRVCDRPRTAGQLVRAIRGDVSRLEAWAAEAEVRPRRVLVVLGELPAVPRGVWAAGPGSFWDELVRMAGHVNAAREVLKVSHGEIPLTTLRMLDAEVIVEFGQGRSQGQWRELYRSWSEVGRMQAIEGQRVRCVGEEEWLSAGPRIAIGLHRLMAALGEFGGE